MCDLTLCNLSTNCCKDLVGRGLGLFRSLYAKLRRKVKGDKDFRETLGQGGRERLDSVCCATI